jgi:hypothetical protein
VTPQLISPNDATAGPKEWKPSATCPHDLLKNLRANSDIYPYKTGRDGSKIFDSVASLAGATAHPGRSGGVRTANIRLSRFGSPQAPITSEVFIFCIFRGRRRIRLLRGPASAHLAGPCPAPTLSERPCVPVPKEHDLAPLSRSNRDRRREAPRGDLAGQIALPDKSH